MRQKTEPIMIVDWTLRDTFWWNLTLSRALGAMQRDYTAIAISIKLAVPISGMGNMAGKQ